VIANPTLSARANSFARNQSMIRKKWEPAFRRIMLQRDKEHLMLDVVMLALGLGFFVLAVGYTYACERL
jgi:hypothetical protein